MMLFLLVVVVMSLALAAFRRWGYPALVAVDGEEQAYYFWRVLLAICALIVVLAIILMIL